MHIHVQKPCIRASSTFFYIFRQSFQLIWELSSIIKLYCMNMKRRWKNRNKFLFPFKKWVELYVRYALRYIYYNRNKRQENIEWDERGCAINYDCGLIKSINLEKGSKKFKSKRPSTPLTYRSFLHCNHWRSKNEKKCHCYIFPVIFFNWVSYNWMQRQ